VVEDGLIDYLLADTDVKALVGTRVYPVAVAQDVVRPYITIQRIAVDRTYDHDGETGLCAPLIQIDCWADTYRGAKTLADKVRLAISGYNGALGGYTAQAILIQNEVDLSEGPSTGSEKVIHRVSIDASVWFNEVVPS